jgi:hypothetical protein
MFSESAQPMKVLKTVSNHLNRYSDIQKPALAYDPKYREVLINVVKDTDLTTGWDTDKPLVYSEM